MSYCLKCTFCRTFIYGAQQVQGFVRSAWTELSLLILTFVHIQSQGHFIAVTAKIVTLSGKR